jgi:alpha-glucosidase
MRLIINQNQIATISIRIRRDCLAIFTAVIKVQGRGCRHGCKTVLLWVMGLGCLAGLRADEAWAPVPTNPIAMVGDSLTRQGDWVKALGRPDVTNWGHPGYTTGQLAWTFKDLARQQPGLKVVFLTGGTNDLLLGVPPGRVYENQVEAVAYWRARGIVPVLQSIVLKRGDPESNKPIKEINERLRAFCTAEQVNYLDLNAVLAKDGELRAEFTTEGTHLRPEAYPLWAEQVLKVLARLGY